MRYKIVIEPTESYDEHGKWLGVIVARHAVKAAALTAARNLAADSTPPGQRVRLVDEYAAPKRWSDWIVLPTGGLRRYAYRFA